MTRFGYGYVPEKGFIAFSHDLSEGAWTDVTIAPYDNAQRLLGKTPLELPRDVGWKLRATWSIAALRDALGQSPEVLAGLDASWDSTQRKLFHLLGSAAEDGERAVRDAAVRLQAALLDGNGTAQTKLGYDEEVDFGRRQIHLMSEGALVADVARLRLGELRDQIARATDALAQGIGRGPGEKRAGSRSQRTRAALTACAADFNGIHGELSWFIEHTAPGKERSRLERMLAPFQSLLERYPAPAGAKGADAAPEAPPVDPPAPPSPVPA